MTEEEKVDAVEEVEAAKEEPKELTEEEKAELERKREVFRTLHDYFLDTDIYGTEGMLGAMEGLLDKALQGYQHKLKVSDVDVETEDVKIKEVAELLKDCTLSEAVSYCRALYNALYQHRYQKTKEMTIRDLEIKLL
jgi:hypothetical protein